MISKTAMQLENLIQHIIASPYGGIDIIIERKLQYIEVDSKIINYDDIQMSEVQESGFNI